MEVGWVVGTKSIENLISISGDNPGSSSGQYQEIQIFLGLYNSSSLTSIPLIKINYPRQPLFINLLAPKPEVWLYSTKQHFPKKREKWLSNISNLTTLL
jgi:hypothetical protein